MRSYPIASELSFESLQKRLRSRELTAPELNEANRQRFCLPRLIVRDAVIADRIVGVDPDQWITRKRERELLK